MKFLFVFFITLLTLNNIKAQSESLIDTISNRICNDIKINNIKIDTTNFYDLISWHIKRNVMIITDKQLSVLVNKVFYNLNFNCYILSTILPEIAKDIGDWKILNSEPISNISKEDCRKFFKTTNFKYYESPNKFTKVLITNKSWVDRFDDGTSSKLSLKQTSYNRFEITFIESNNLSRKAGSKKGDIYQYKILKKNKNSYLIFMKNPKVNGLYSFNLYY